MTGELRNVWYLAVVLAVFLAGFGSASPAAAGLPGYCWDECGETAGCNDPCFPEPESGLITCGDYDDGYENGWCNPYNCANACGDGLCDSQFCGESISGSTCCTADCGSCSTAGECETNEQCGSGECCNADNECVDCTPPEPEEDPICLAECSDDSDCCPGDICRGHPLLGGKCVTAGETVCPSAPTCTSTEQCNTFVSDCLGVNGPCYCSPSINRCLFTGTVTCPVPNDAELCSVENLR